MQRKKLLKETRHWTYSKHFLGLGVALKGPRQSFFECKDIPSRLISDIQQRDREGKSENFLSLVLFSQYLSKFQIRLFAVWSEQRHLRFRACFSLCGKRDWEEEEKEEEKEGEEKSTHKSMIIWQIFSPHAGLENHSSLKCPPTWSHKNLNIPLQSPL